MNIDFKNNGLPEGWEIDSVDYRFSDGYLHTGANTIIRLPAAACGGLCRTLELEVLVTAQSMIYCGDMTFNLMVEPGMGRCQLRHYGRMTMAEAALPAPASHNDPIVLKFMLDSRSWRVMMNGELVMDAAVPPTDNSASILNLGFTHNCRVRAIRLPASAPPPVSAPVPARDFHLEVAVDFPDDVMHAPFDRRMFDQLFDEFAEWGVRRCHWIYYGGRQSGWWRNCRCGGGLGAENVALTFDNVGDLISTAVQAAHKRGIELYSLIKPFDMGFQHSRADILSANNAGRSGLSRIGGIVDWIADFVAVNRDLVMARKPSALIAPPDIFTGIDLVKNDDVPAKFKVADVELWVSDDNQTYRPYAGPMQREEVVMNYPRWEHTSAGGRPSGATARARVMRLRGLLLDSPYIALRVPAGAGSFGNDLLNLVHVHGGGEATRNWTPGLMPRLTGARPDGASSVLQHGDFSVCGFEFDQVPGTPTAIFPGYNHWTSMHVLDAGHGTLGIARGRNPGALAALSPHYRAARDWWLMLIRQSLDAGADGIELRVRNHHSPPAWCEFGFEQPVRDEFLARYGVDIWATDDFDRTAWRRLRGEAHTEFYRAARALTRDYNRKMGLHVSQTMCLEPELASAMDIHWDWRTWLNEGLADSVTMKEIWPGSRFAEEVQAVARACGLPAIFAPYANTLWSGSGGVEACERRIRLARDHGLAGFQFYECAAVMRGERDGQVQMRQPELRAMFKRYFGR